MEQYIEAFIMYLHNVKKTSDNTTMSYKRDLYKWMDYMKAQGIVSLEAIEEEHLTAFVAYLEDKKFKAATISRNIASIKAFYHYLVKLGVVTDDISVSLKAPKIEKKMPLF